MDDPSVSENCERFYSEKQTNKRHPWPAVLRSRPIAKPFLHGCEIFRSHAVLSELAASDGEGVFWPTTAARQVMCFYTAIPTAALTINASTARGLSTDDCRNVSAAIMKQSHTVEQMKAVHSLTSPGAA